MHNLSEYKELYHYDSKRSLVRNEITGDVCMMKRLTYYDEDVYAFLASHNDKHIPQIYDYWKADDNTLIVIEEVVQGNTFDNIIFDNRMPENDKLKLFLEMLEGLKFLHNAPKPIIHRDLKASNIMVTGNGEVKIIDYDAAKIYKPDSSGDTTHLGTDGVAAPEQYGFMQSDTRSDVYAVGKMLANAFPDNKRIQTVAAKASSFDPRDRYANAGELSDVLAGKVCLKSKLKNPFPPPGYRTRKLWKMIVASLGYPFLVVWTVTFDGRKDPLVNFGLKLFWAVFILVAIDICCSWTGIFDHLPFITHKNPFLRGLFKALFVTASAIVIMLLIVILLTIIALATDAYAV